MRGMPGIRHNPGMRRLPRPGWAGGSPELVSVPRLPGRRRRAGAGHGGTAARDGSGRGMGTSVPCKVTVPELPGRTPPARGCVALRPAARPFPAPPQGATCGVQPRCLGALSSALVGVQPTTAPSAPSRGAGKAAASSRCALLPRRASVVSTSEAGTDDAGNVTSCLVDRHVLRTNSQLTRHFSAVRKVATRLPQDVQAKRLTQPRIGALQGRRACSHAGNRVSHSVHSNICKRLCRLPGVRQIRAIFTYLMEVPETHA